MKSWQEPPQHIIPITFEENALNTNCKKGGFDYVGFPGASSIDELEIFLKRRCLSLRHC